MKTYVAAVWNTRNRQMSDIRFLISQPRAAPAGHRHSALLQVDRKDSLFTRFWFVVKHLDDGILADGLAKDISKNSFSSIGVVLKFS